VKVIVGIYIRMTAAELDRLRDDPAVLPKYDPRVALDDGRGLDLGRGWESLGVFLDGGITLPDVGPTVGEHPLPHVDERAAWSYVEPARVAEFASELSSMNRGEFYRRYQVDNEDTQDIPDMRTGGWGSRQQYLFKKLRALAHHYAEAARRGEGMLVRIGERV
jgi:hypothetical protein